MSLLCPLYRKPHRDCSYIFCEYSENPPYGFTLKKVDASGPKYSVFSSHKPSTLLQQVVEIV